MIRLLLVDDDPQLCVDLSTGLGALGYSCDASGDVESALKRLEDRGAYDLVLLDVTLPGGTGWSLLERLRQVDEQVAVVFLSAHGTAQDRVQGLRLGADDYVVKPFEFEELVARIEAVLRRRRPPELYELDTGAEPVVVDLSARRAERGGMDLELSKRELEVLAALVRADGGALARRDLLQTVWDLPGETETNVVEVAVMRLRRKLDRGGGHAIRTIPGEGYAVRPRRVRP